MVTEQNFVATSTGKQIYLIHFYCMSVKSGLCVFIVFQCCLFSDLVASSCLAVSPLSVFLHCFPIIFEVQSIKSGHDPNISGWNDVQPKQTALRSFCWLKNCFFSFNKCPQGTDCEFIKLIFFVPSGVYSICFRSIHAKVYNLSCKIISSFSIPRQFPGPQDKVAF